MEKKVLEASRPFEAENPDNDPAKKTQITLRIQDSHGKGINLKVSKTIHFKVIMNTACSRLGILMADAQFTHGGRQLKPTDTAESFGLCDHDLIKVDDFIKIDDLIEEEETKDEDEAAKAAREMFEAAQREWEGGKSQDTMLTSAEKAKQTEKEKAELAKWQASMRSTLASLPYPRSAEEARRKAEQVVGLMSEDEVGGLIFGSSSNQLGSYLGQTTNVTRFAIPALRFSDSSIRFRKFVKGVQKTVTCWPSGLALAATWDEELVGRVGTAMAVELRGKGVNVMLGPSVSVHRVASAGRNFEQLSGEDPYLGARLVRSFVRAVQKEGILAGVRPFGFTQQETNRKEIDAQVDDRVAWELYYPPFEAAVQAGAGAVTCSNTKVNGVMGCENPKLLKTDLKGSMGFKGFVLTEDTLASFASALSNGVDVSILGASDKKSARNSPLRAAMAEVKSEAAAHVLAALYRHRIDELPVWKSNLGATAQASDQRTRENKDLAQEAAAASVVLLKNNGVLPLDPTSIKRLAVLGSAASTVPKTAQTADYFSGGGPSHVPAMNAAAATALDQITKRAATAKMTVTSFTSSNTDLDKATEVANAADVIIIVGATTSTEGSDRSTLALDDNVDELIAAVAHLKPTVVLMQTPGAVLTPWRGDVAAVANLFLAGEATGSAWASMLFGDVPPSGRLPLSMPKTADDAIRPTAQGTVRYIEGLHTGYRSNTMEAAFPFGHGLSYTEFTYGAPQLADRGCLARACISLDIVNIGHLPGHEVVQAYLEFPDAEDMPTRVLRSFQRTSMLQPGQTEQVILVLTARDLSTWHPDAGWVEQQNIKVDIGSSSADIRQTTWVNIAVDVDIS